MTAEPLQARGASTGPLPAREIVAGAVVPLAPVSVELARAGGGVLADRLWARNPLPPFDVSAMDGYAVRGPGPWRLRGTTLAGDPPGEGLGDGDAVAVATGSALPDGCEGVLRTEDAVREAGEILGPAPAGRDVRHRGEECPPWTPVLAAGTLVTPTVLALAAALGYDELTVRPRSRVLVIVTGRELLTAGDPRGGRIRDALGPLVVAALAALGAVALPPVRTGDDEAALVGALGGGRGPDADLVITTGGTADGPADRVRAALARVGAQVVLDGLAVRPGRPTLFSLMPSAAPGPGSAPVPVLSLPGNPLAALVGLTVAGTAALAALAGRPARAPGTALLAAAVPAHPRSTRAVPVRRRHGVALPVGPDRAAGLWGAALADGLALIPPGSRAEVGDPVAVLDIPGTAPEL